MSSFSDRLTAAQAFETTVIERFRTSGWLAFPFGQALLPEECRDMLKRAEDRLLRPSLIRWMPDIIVLSQATADRIVLALVDAKRCADKPNYSIEKDALETAQAFGVHLFTATFFVFDDWKVLTPRDVQQRGTHGPENCSGSGTPYFLVSKRYGREFTSVFPPVKPVMVG